VDGNAVARLMDLQCGVISRRQFMDAGGDDNDLQRLVRRRMLTRVLPGVYVGHTGPLDDRQRAWAAVLYAEPAALAGTDALHAHGVRGFTPSPEQAVHLVVPASRRVREQSGVRVSRLGTFDRDVQAHLSPPRLRLEEAAIDVAAAARDDDGVVSILGDVCQTRRTTAGRLLRALEGRSRLRHRPLINTVLADVSSGAFSALERRYLVKVERAHGLPTGSRQRRARPGRRAYYRDVEYLGLHTDVELDGRIGHTSEGDRWSDLDRDLEAATAGDLTVRVGWLQVLEAHRLANALGRLLAVRGWSGRIRRCGPECSIR
jgi:hypothetical protein